MGDIQPTLWSRKRMFLYRNESMLTWSKPLNKECVRAHVLTF